MSGIRGLVPAAVAVGLGVFTGYYTFQPAFQQIDAERRTKSQEDPQPSVENNKSVRPPDRKAYVSSWNAPPPLPPPVSAETPEDAAQPRRPSRSWMQWLWGFGSSAGKSPASSREDRNLVQSEETHPNEVQGRSSNKSYK